MLKGASLYCYISSVFLSSRDDADDGGPEIGLEQKDAAHIVFMEGCPETCLVTHIEGTAVSLRLNLCTKGWIVMHSPSSHSPSCALVHTTGTRPCYIQGQITPLCIREVRLNVTLVTLFWMCYWEFHYAQIHSGVRCGL